MYLQTQHPSGPPRHPSVRLGPPRSAWPSRPPTRAPASNPLVTLAAIGLGLYLLDRLLDDRKPRERVPDDVKDEVSRRAGWQCEYCGVRVTRSTRHIDHSVSLANRGTNSVRNLRNACAPCNLSKGAMNGRDFRRLID